MVMLTAIQTGRKRKSRTKEAQGLVGNANELREHSTIHNMLASNKKNA